MNNDSTPTTPADPHRTSYAHLEDDADADADGPAQPAVSEPEHEPNQNGGAATTTQNPSLSQAAKDGLKKKLQLMMHLSTSLDSVVYAELCALYYMEYDESNPPKSRSIRGSASTSHRASKSLLTNFL